jgi:signal transduction histidine kinase
MEGQYSRVDIYALTRDLASSFRSAIEKAGMELTISCGVLTADVYVDVDQWERIILNLVSNAFKYSQEGSITVHVEQSGNNILVRISDTGVGIPEEQLNLIFDRFHRIDSVQGRSQEGTGIGLAMVKELVRLHQGTITVTSRVGAGSTFQIAIPVGKDHLPADKIVALPEPVLKHTESFVAEALKWLPEVSEDKEVNEIENIGARAGGTVLLADDNADMREYVQRLLSTQFTVITAINGEEAFHKMLEFQPDLLLSDIMMPMMDGFGLLEKIRSHPLVKHTPVIFLSARAGDEAKIEGLDAGADDYLVKPFSAKELLARVDANIRIARSRTEHAGRMEEEVRVRTRELRELNVALKDLNSSLQKSNEDLQQFAHVASHDLKEPVRKIRTFSSRLREEYGAALPEQARVFLNKIDQATTRMYSMIEGVLAYSILNGSEQTIEPVDLNVIITNIEIDLEVTIGEKRASLVRGRLPRIEGASVLIYQLFYNLINNSLKFARVGVPPVIEVVAKVLQEEGSPEAMAEITLTDNGIGFEQEHADRIFNTFARLHAKDKYEGTGLGLALCRKIVDRHLGSIRAKGEKNRGAVFVILLPLVQHRKSL